ncbi:hypothetical protein [Schlesneria sp. DSM 10557]|uniref:hypothetical protein n=1 Tax=Schlesneria sp. DSM 10557 TaxID=3044399 RepID=UPI00359FD9FC
MVAYDPEALASEFDADQKKVCDAIERLLALATHRTPKGHIFDVLTRIIGELVRYHTEMAKVVDENVVSVINENEKGQLIYALWCVITARGDREKLQISDWPTLGITSETTRRQFADQNVIDWCSLLPDTNRHHTLFNGNVSLQEHNKLMFEEFLVAFLIHHSLSSPDGWMSLKVSLSSLFEFIDALGLSEQEPVCRDLLRTMVIVGQQRMQEGLAIFNAMQSW